MQLKKLQWQRQFYVTPAGEILDAKTTPWPTVDQIKQRKWATAHWAQGADGLYEITYTGKAWVALHNGRLIATGAPTLAGHGEVYNAVVKPRKAVA